MIGAGAAGLAAGRTLADRGLDVHVLEAGPRPGGVMDTVQKDDFLFERGPNTFRLTGPALAFLRGAGVEAALVKARSDGGKRFLLRHGELEAVPMSPLAFATSPMLSARAKLRLLAEPFTARADGGGETVAEFIERRMGPEVLEHLVGPFLVGVYAGDEHSLGAEAVFPALVEYERAAGSIVAGAIRDRFQGDAPKGAPGSWSASGGMAGLVQALARPLGERLHVDCPARVLARDRDAWCVETDQVTYRTARVILAAPAKPAA